MQPQRVVPRGFARGPHTSPTFIPPPPVHVRPFGNPMVYPDVPPSLVYVPGPTPESLRGVPIMAPSHPIYLAMVLYHAGDMAGAIMQQHKELIINESTLMDYVGCEKCRLWGKLQVLGLGTALNILFSVDGQNNPTQPLQLHRNEVIALLNLLNRLSESIKFVHEKGPC